jgi:hypothetical protein
LKDKIDRDWMRGYQQLPTMEEMAEMVAAKAQQVKRSGTVAFCRTILELHRPAVFGLRI